MTTNYTLVAPTAILDTPFQIEGFEIPETEEFYSIRGYLESLGQTIELYTADKTVFAKPFAFRPRHVKAIEDLAGAIGMTYTDDPEVEADIKVLFITDLAIEMAKPRWQSETQI